MSKAIVHLPFTAAGAWNTGAYPGVPRAPRGSPNRIRGGRGNVTLKTLISKGNLACPSILGVVNRAEN